MKLSLEMKVGVLVLFCTGLLAAFVWVLGDFGGSGSFVLHADFETASDIKVGAPVKVAGVPAGKVSEVRYWGGQLDEKSGRRVVVRVTCNLDPLIGPTLHQDARLYISTLGMLGEKYIEVDPGDFDKPALADGASIEGMPPLRMEVLAQQLSKVSRAVTRILESNEDSLSGIFRHADETLLVAKQVAQDADRLIVDNRDTLKSALERVNGTAIKVDRLVDATLHGVGDGGEIRRSLRHVEGLTARIHQDSGPVLQDTRAITGELKRYSGRLNAEPTVQVALGKAGQDKALGVIDHVDRTLTQADAAVADVKALTGHARQGKGTVGGVMMDNELFMDIKLMVKDLKRHPWKFIWRE